MPRLLRTSTALADRVTPAWRLEGQNQIFGASGGGAGGIDRDYFTFTVPVDLEITSIVVLPNTVTGGSLSFFGLQAGNQITVLPDATDATGLLGWPHYNAANGNILHDLSIPALGSTGFVPPLGSGSYAFWIQEFDPGQFEYGFDFGLERVSSTVPDSGPGAIGCATLLGVLLACGRLRPTCRARKSPFLP